MTQDPYVDPDELIDINRRHDQALHASHIPTSGRLRSSWNNASLSRRGPLTDKQIARYQKLGFYSLEFKAARKALMQKKKLQFHLRRTGNFFEQDGRLIYSPG